MGLTEELTCYCHQLFETWALLGGHDILAESLLLNKAQIFSYMATYMMQQLGKLVSPEHFFYELNVIAQLAIINTTAKQLLKTIFHKHICWAYDNV